MSSKRQVKGKLVHVLQIAVKRDACYLFNLLGPVPTPNFSWAEPNSN